MHLFSIATRSKKYQVLDACFKKRRKRYCRRLAGCGIEITIHQKSY